jgi:DNA (cytosine-5)-methyltransferase 1
MRYVVNNARPFIVPMTHGNRPTSTDEPLQTITTQGNRFNLVVPTLINTRNGERVGQAPRIRDIERPLPTITAQGSQGALVAAFLARHYGGHENDGHPVTRPMSTITTQDHHHLVTSSIVKLRGDNTGHDVREPLHTISAQGRHLGEVRAFLLKYYGNERDGHDITNPLGTVTTKERFGLVTVRGEPYEIVDIGMRMLEARELARATSFPDDYVLDPDFEGKPLSKTDQVWMIGNAVPPVMSEALVRANYSRRAA